MSVHMPCLKIHNSVTFHYKRSLIVGHNSIETNFILHFIYVEVTKYIFALSSFALIYFNWRVIALSVVLVSAKHQQNQYTSVPSLRPCSMSYPQLLQEHQFEFPGVTWQIPTGCPFHVWWYMSACCSFLASALSFLPCSDRVRTSVLFVWVSICCPENRFISVIFQIPYICVSIWDLFFSFWLNSLCIIGSVFVHLIRTDSNALLLLAG